ncbi:hypothetical protein [Brevundimonas pishanensis]|uniref:hypothetical protein n=1 Tax=Brevundimonas pishanensis TaxID=2896315 RepID=UPI001FA8110D|nr:hypothetical protein [Brevundimonas pishanensis]
MKQANHLPLAASVALAALVAAVPAVAQSAQELTRSLNSRPASPTGAATTSPQSRPAVAPAAQPAPAGQAAPAPARSSTPAQAPAQTPAPVAAPATTAPAAPAAEVSAAPPPVRVIPLNAEAISTLPFRIDLRGAQIVERPAGPRAKIYSVSRAEKPLLMIYAGPQSDYPIYDGEQATVAGRTSIILSDGGVRRAVEHLFRRDDAQPADIHVWLITTDGADGALAEQIGQSVDPR